MCRRLFVHEIFEESVIKPAETAAPECCDVSLWRLEFCADVITDFCNVIIILILCCYVCMRFYANFDSAT